MSNNVKLNIQALNPKALKRIVAALSINPGNSHISQLSPDTIEVIGDLARGAVLLSLKEAFPKDYVSGRVDTL